MALTKEQWFENLKTWVPSWFFEASNLQAALFKGIAAGMAQVQADADALIDETFITEAESDTLDLHAEERGVNRIPGELDPAFRARVQVITNATKQSSIQQAIDGTLNNGTSVLIENINYGYFEDSLFLDDEETRMLDSTKNYHWFTVITPVQTGGDTALIRTSLINSIEQIKTLGVTYDIWFQT